MFIYFSGLFLGLSLVSSLGPQNVFLIKQGVKKNHPTLSAAICFICDIILVCASVTGLHQLLLANPTLQMGMTWLGSGFLFYYATKALRSAFSNKNEAQDKTSQPHNRLQIVLFALGFSLLNPHAIIDTLVIIGSGSNQFPNHQLEFTTGVLTSSFLWFCCLTITTRYFANILNSSAVWRIIELFSGIVMGGIGIKLILSCI
jgi:L-lysine exporter family protein LysE/ArgO